MKIQKLTHGPLGTNTYFATGDNGKTLIIDPGIGENEVSDFVSENAFSICGILLTHGHFDHEFSSGALAAMYGVKVFVSSEDAPLLGDPEKNAGNLFFPEGFSYPRNSPDVILFDNDEIKLGSEKFVVICTPGHTAGSVIFDNGTEMITGDTVFRGTFGRCDLYGGNREKLSASLEKLAAIPGDRVIYPGHGEKTLLSRERPSMIK